MIEHKMYISALYLLLSNLVAFVVYGIDKYKARKGKWRIPESTLLTLAMFGESIGAWLAMKAFHHKTMHKKLYARPTFRQPRHRLLPSDRRGADKHKGYVCTHNTLTE